MVSFEAGIVCLQSLHHRIGAYGGEECFSGVAGSVWRQNKGGNRDRAGRLGQERSEERNKVESARSKKFCAICGGVGLSGPT